MSHPKTRIPHAASLAAVLFLLAGSGADAQRDRGRVSGTLKDASGKPAEGVVLVLVPEEAGAGARPQKATVNKKGKFSIAYVPVGSWRVETEDPSLFLESMRYVHRNAQGVKTGERDGRGDVSEGLPPIEVELNGRGQLTLVLAESGARQQAEGRLRLMAATGPLKAAVDLYEAGEMDAAVAAVEAILLETPDLVEATFVRGAALSQLGRYSEAEPHLRVAVAAKPEIPRIQGIFSLVLISHAEELAASGDADGARERYVEAIGQLEEQIRRVPDDSSYRVNLVVALEGAREAGRLEEALRSVLEVDPKNVPVAMRLAGLYGSGGRPEDAARVVAESGLSGRDAANTLYNIAAELYNDGKNDEAEVYAGMVRAADPEQPEVLGLLGYLRLAAGDTEAALAFFRDFVDRVPAEQSETERGLIEALLANR